MSKHKPCRKETRDLPHPQNSHDDLPVVAVTLVLLLFLLPVLDSAQILGMEHTLRPFRNGAH